MQAKLDSLAIRTNDRVGESRRATVVTKTTDRQFNNVHDGCTEASTRAKNIRGLSAV